MYYCNKEVELKTLVGKKITNIKGLEKEIILNIAASVGMDVNNEVAILQFADEMQAFALLNYARWCRKSGAAKDRISWVDAAINAELMAAELAVFTIES